MRVIENHPCPRFLAQLAQHVVVLVKEQLEGKAWWRKLVRFDLIMLNEKRKRYNIYLHIQGYIACN